MQSKTRTESDTFGPIEVDATRYWGAQTQRSLQNFKIGIERMPRPLIRGLGIVKYASAEVNRDLGLTVLLVEQNANLALEISHYGYVLETGAVLFHDRSERLKLDPRVREAYLGA